ncbi:Pentatricopeptide repeat-containing protein At3g23020 [Linum perenne]
MDEKGLDIDEYTQSALTRMYIESGMLEKSWLWFRRFHLAGNMTSRGYAANIDAYGERGHKRFSEAIETFKEMLDDGVRPDKITFKSLGLVLLKCGISKKTVGRLKSAVEKDYQSGVQAWLIALYTMVDADR